MGFKVYKEYCNNCLLSPDRIVSPQAAKEIIKDCTNEQSYFVCHKASMKDKEVCCKKFYDELGHTSQMIRIAERLNAIEFVEQEDDTKLIPYTQQKHCKKA